MKKEQIKVMISKVKNKIWLFLKKIYAKQLIRSQLKKKL